MAFPKVAMIVPTLGERDHYLRECLSSIRSAGFCHIVLVAPADYDATPWKLDDLVDSLIEDRGNGLADAINEAARQLPSDITYFNWLGDDDRLFPDAIEVALNVLLASNADFVWGGCRYIDKQGNVIGTNRSGAWAKKLMKVGPDLIPQPGALFSRRLFESVGGLDSSYRLAFDYDLFMNFAAHGRCVYIPRVLAAYRWHEDALSTKHRATSVLEARKVRQQHLASYLRPMSVIWERPISYATYIAGKAVNRLVARRQVRIRRENQTTG